jgi:hypothetical protein
VLDGGRGENYAGDFRIAEDFVVRAAELKGGILGPSGFECGGILIAEHVERAKLEEVPGQVFAPVSMAYNSDFGAHSVSVSSIGLLRERLSEN